MKALAFPAFAVAALAQTNAPLGLPSWLAPFPHEKETKIIETSDRVRIGYDASAPFANLLGYFETVLRQAGVAYQEGPGPSGGASFRLSKDGIRCTVQIQGSPAAAVTRVETECTRSVEPQGPTFTSSPQSVAPVRIEKQKAESQGELLRGAIKFSVLAKGFIPSDPSTSRYESLLTLNCTYQNASARDIRAFTGIVSFQDLFGRPILNLRITISDPIPAGGSATWNGTSHYNQFMESNQRFLETSLNDMRVVWQTASIIFSDGAQIGELR